MSENISNAELMAQSSLPGLARMVQLKIIIEGRIISHFKHFRLRQSTSTHHRFELILADDVLKKKQDHHLEEARGFLGKRITVVFTYKDTEIQSPERNFVGVITRVGFSRKKTSLGDIILKGYSPTILMDAAPHFQSFGGTQPANTAAIAGNIIHQSIDSSRFDVRIDTRTNSYINYSSQYNESHYNYLSRLAQAYGEQFFYDGQTLHFGKLPPHEKPICLTYGSSIQKINVKLNAVYTKPTYFGYNSSNNKKMEGTDMEIHHLGELASVAYELNQGIFTTDSLIPAPLNANMELDVDGSQKSIRGSAAVKVLTVSGKTTVPFLYPACVADLELRKPDSGTTSYFTRIMITQVSHEVDALGNYSGKFKAIAEGTGFLPRPGIKIPKADPQTATVVSNTDPLGQGRVQVRFQWQSAGSSTHFIRMMSPDAGGSEEVQQNRGFVAVPEVGDQVMVGFEYHHPDFPFAMGAMFHGNIARGGGIENHLKSIQTRSGIKVLMNDLHRSVTIEDPSGNTYLMDGRGNINVTAPKSMKFNAGEDIEMNAGKNLQINTGNNMEFLSGNLAAFHMISGAIFSTPLMEMSVPAHFNIQSGKTTLLSEEETVIQGKTLNVAGMEKLMIHSEQETTVNSKGQTQVLGKDGNHLSNTPRDYAPAERRMDGRCLAHFRPRAAWNGEGYGFDWVRAGDTTFPGDIPYSEIVGKISNGSFKRSHDEYLKLISTFSYYNYVDINEDGDESNRSYAFPYLSLYPKTYFRTINGERIRKVSKYTNTSAELKLIITNKENLEEMTLEYDTAKFRIEHDPFPLNRGNHKIRLTVKCIEEFSNDRKIQIFARLRDERGRGQKLLAGGLKVKANQIRYEVPIVFIEVITNIGNQKRFPIIGPREFEIQKYLNQALINPVFHHLLTLDCSVDVNPQSGFRHNRRTGFNRAAALEQNHRGEMVLNADRHNNDVIKFLNEQLNTRFPGKYDQTIKVYFINEICGNDAGYGTPHYKTAVLFRGGFNSPNRSVTAHEIMHAMDLYHTFERKSKFVFQKYQTDNLMDYSDVPGLGTKSVFTTYHWQWDILQQHSQLEVSSSNFHQFPKTGDEYVVLNF